MQRVRVEDSAGVSNPGGKWLPSCLVCDDLGCEFCPHWRTALSKRPPPTIGGVGVPTPPQPPAFLLPKSGGNGPADDNEGPAQLAA